ncbi:hypothetical protein MUK42_36654 [Musa troglodytarum]|uniref:Uncharacterized protein n=1 Tax=Musa troglodytarum TaxID=320322 RepID=A0A9E7J9U7_9LILI|nr:hypothetical protein MUK42_36654 [Musa troglodytarum]
MRSRQAFPLLLLLLSSIPRPIPISCKEDTIHDYTCMNDMKTMDKNVISMMVMDGDAVGGCCGGGW